MEYLLPLTKLRTGVARFKSAGNRDLHNLKRTPRQDMRNRASCPRSSEAGYPQRAPRCGAPEGVSTTWRQPPDGKGRCTEQADGPSEDETALDMLVELSCTLRHAARTHRMCQLVDPHRGRAASPNPTSCNTRSVLRLAFGVRQQPAEALIVRCLLTDLAMAVESFATRFLGVGTARESPIARPPSPGVGGHSAR